MMDTQHSDIVRFTLLIHLIHVAMLVSLPEERASVKILDMFIINYVKFN